MGTRTIESEWQETHAALHPKQLVHNCVLWGDPARESKVAQRRKDEIWKPVPAERDAEDQAEKGITGYLPGCVAEAFTALG